MHILIVIFTRKNQLHLMKCKQVLAWGTGRNLLINAIKSDQALMIKKTRTRPGGRVLILEETYEEVFVVCDYAYKITR